MGALVSFPNASTPVERILGRFDRAQLEGFISVAIDLLDMADGDPDIEDDDPSGTPLDQGEGDEATIVATKPIYGPDQSTGPINEREAIAEHQAKELGLERSPTGGWRRKAQ